VMREGLIAATGPRKRLVVKKMVDCADDGTK